LEKRKGVMWVRGREWSEREKVREELNGRPKRNERPIQCFDLD